MFVSDSPLAPPEVSRRSFSCCLFLDNFCLSSRNEAPFLKVVFMFNAPVLKPMSLLRVVFELDRMFIFTLELDWVFIFTFELGRVFIFIAELGRVFIFTLELDWVFIFTFELDRVFTFAFELDTETGVITSRLLCNIKGSLTPKPAKRLPIAFFNSTIVLLTSDKPAFFAIRFTCADFTDELKSNS